MNLFTKLFIVFFLFFTSCSSPVDKDITSTENNFNHQDYEKEERYITMRDGVRLFTTIYSPKDKSQDYPVILKRTPYSCRPYGEDTIPQSINKNLDLVKSGYIFVQQDMRGRWMSYGKFENTKPPYSLWDTTQTDELTDSWDTFEWLLDSLDNYNGRAGMMGNSYLGWTSLVGARCNHSSLKAVVAMAPVTNFYFEDFNRYGLFGLSYLPVISVFGTDKNEPVDTAWWADKSEAYGIDKENGTTPDYYDFFLKRLTLNNYTDIIDSTDSFWQFIKAHANYDKARQQRDWIQYLDEIKCNIMIVGGWNDEQNLYGILNSYKKIEKSSNQKNAKFIMGPWSHGHPTALDSTYYLGDVFYGYNLSKDYLEGDEFNYFEHHLKQMGNDLDFQVKLFDTGLNEWTIFKNYPETNELDTFHLQNRQMTTDLLSAEDKELYTEFIADPFHPVPYIEGDEFHKMAPKRYFTADQRFVSKRPDVITFETEVLPEDITVLGEILAELIFETNHSAADLYVKIIDVYPMNRTRLSTDPEGVKMNGYQQLVRCGYIRGRYRESYESPTPFMANTKTSVDVPLLDVYHTFKKGHKIMVQIQSSMFPLFDLNPQRYVEDIYNAQRSDFTVSKHRIYNESKVILPIQSNGNAKD